MFKRKTILYIFIVILLVILITFIYYFRVRILKILTPFFMAIVITYLLRPAVIGLERKGVKRNLGIILMYGIFLAVLTGLAIYIVPQFISNTRELVNILPEVTVKYQNTLNNLIASIQSSRWPEDLKNVIYEQIYNSTQIAQNFMTNLLKNTAYTLIKAISMLFDLILALIIAYYLIKDADFFKEIALSLTPKKQRNSYIMAGRDMNNVLNDFVKGQLLTALIVGIIETAGLLLVKVKFAIVLGSLGGLANIIPYFGPIFGAIPAIAVALIDSPQKALWTILVFVVVQQLDNALISPKIIEGRLGLHPVTSILVVLIGGEFFGILGFFLAVPVFALLKVILKKIIEEIV